MLNQFDSHRYTFVTQPNARTVKQYTFLCCSMAEVHGHFRGSVSVWLRLA